MKGRERIKVVDTSTPRLASSIPSLPEEETVLVRLLRIAAAQMADTFEPGLRSCGLAENQFNVLCYLCASESGSLAPSALAELIGTSRPNITRILRDLVKAGHVELCDAEHDGRSSFAVITERGRERTRQSVPLMAEPIMAAFHGLSTVDRKALNRLLRKLILSIDDGADKRRTAA